MTPAVNQAIKTSGLPWEGKDSGARKDLLSASCFIHGVLSRAEEFGSQKNAKEKPEGLPKISLSLGIPSLAKEKDSMAPARGLERTKLFGLSWWQSQKLKKLFQKILKI